MNGMLECDSDEETRENAPGYTPRIDAAERRSSRGPNEGSSQRDYLDFPEEVFTNQSPKKWHRFKQMKPVVVLLR